MEKKISAKTAKELLKIAMENSVVVEERGDLERRWNDEEDFLDISVWGLKAMLEQAYQLGREDK